MKIVQPWVKPFLYDALNAYAIESLDDVYIDKDGFPYDKHFGKIIHGNKHGADFASGETYGLYDVEVKLTRHVPLIRDVVELADKPAELLNSILHLILPDIYEFPRWELTKIFSFLSGSSKGELLAGSAYDTNIRDIILDEFCEFVFGVYVPTYGSSQEVKDKFKTITDRFSQNHYNYIDKVVARRAADEAKKRKLNTNRHIYLYAKSHYYWSPDPLADLAKIISVRNNCLPEHARVYEHMVDMAAMHLVNGSENQISEFITDLHPNSFSAKAIHATDDTVDRKFTLQVVMRILRLLSSVKTSDINGELGDPDPSILPLIDSHEALDAKLDIFTLFSKLGKKGT